MICLGLLLDPKGHYAASIPNSAESVTLVITSELDVMRDNCVQIHLYTPDTPTGKMLSNEVNALACKI